MAIYPLFSLLTYLVLLFVSTLLTSINRINSFYQLVLWSVYVGVFIIFSYIFVHVPKQKIVVILIFGITVSLFIGQMIHPQFFTFLSTSSYQFILRIHQEHNHLGDIAGLGFIAVLINPTNIFVDALLVLTAAIIMIVSFSKSAFLGVLIVFLVLAIQKRGKYIYGFIVTLLISGIVISIYTQEFSKFPLIKTGQKIMTTYLHLKPKPLLSTRNLYFEQAFFVWKSAPLAQFLFGYGLGNYIYPSLKTGKTLDVTPTETHNIFLSIFIESGFLSLFWFLFFCASSLYLGYKLRNPSLYFYVYLLINFQTDFTYVIPFFMLLFFFFASQGIYKKEKTSNEKLLLRIGCIVILTITTISVISYFFVKKEKKKLDAQLIQAVISQNKSQVYLTIRNLERLTPYEESELIRWSSIQEAMGNTSEAVRLIEKISIYSPHLYLEYLPHQLDLQRKIFINLRKYLTEKKTELELFPYSPDEKYDLNTICNNYAGISCVK
jgi:hypothetical protein